METKKDSPISNSDGNITIEEYENNGLIPMLKSEQDELKINSLLTDISSLINEIFSKFKNEANILCKILNEVINSIKFIISEYSKDFINEDVDSKIILLLKVQKYKKKIKLLNNEINTIKNNFNVNIFNSSDLHSSVNFYELFFKKLNSIKSKFQENELKYLLYIEEQNNKIQDLETELKKKINENLPKNIAKSIRCFPNFVQYNFKEDISPKSVPLHQTLQKCSRSCIKKSVLHLDNQNSNINNNINSDDNSNFFITEDLKNCCSISDYNNKNKVTEFNKNKVKSVIKYNNRNSNRVLNNYDQINSQNSLDSSSRFFISDTFNTDSFKILNKNEIIKTVNEHQPHSLINHSKEYFISHPKIKFAELEKDRKNPSINLWKRLKFKCMNNKNKNQKPVFPSYLNETLVNLQKLRLNKFVVDNYFEKKERNEKVKSKKYN